MGEMVYLSDIQLQILDDALPLLLSHGSYFFNYKDESQELIEKQFKSLQEKIYFSETYDKVKQHFITPEEEQETKKKVEKFRTIPKPSNEEVNH